MFKFIDNDIIVNKNIYDFDDKHKDIIFDKM